MEIFSISTITVRMIFSAVLGGLVGLERETHGQPAGLRTHILVSIGATSAMIVSVHMPMFMGIADPGRIAAQVISGIGFLGAGAIIHYGTSVSGITTAAGIWAVAAVGLVVGAGLYVIASIAIALTLVTLFLLDLFEKRFIAETIHKSISVTLEDVEGEDQKNGVDTIKAVLSDFDLKIKNVSVQRNVEKGSTELSILTKVPGRFSSIDCSQVLSDQEGVIQVEIE